MLPVSKVKSINFKEYVEIIKPEYVYLKITPNNSVRNNNTDKIAKAIANIYIGFTEMIRRDELKLIEFFGKEYEVKKSTIIVPAKVSYYVYMTSQNAEFYFIIPKRYLAEIKEKINNVWGNVAIAEVEEVPRFGENARKYYLQYKNEDGLSLASDRRDNDLLASNLNVIDVLQDGEAVGIFYNFIPYNQFGFAASYRRTLDKFRDGKVVIKNKKDWWYKVNLIANTLCGLINSICEVITIGKSKKEVISDPFAAYMKSFNKKPSSSTNNKATDTIINTQIMILSESTDRIRSYNNARSLGNSFDAIAEDNALEMISARPTSREKRIKKEIKQSEKRRKENLRLIEKGKTPKPDITIKTKQSDKFLQYSIDGPKNKISTREISNFISLPGRTELEKHEMIDHARTNETQIPKKLLKGTAELGVNTYRGAESTVYMSNDKELKYISNVYVGPNRAGKTTFMQRNIYDFINAGECCIFFDFIKGCEASNEAMLAVPEDKRLVINCRDRQNIQAMAFDIFLNNDDPLDFYDNVRMQTNQYLELVDQVNSQNQTLLAKMDRYLTAAAMVAFSQGSAFGNVSKILQNHREREKCINGIPNSIKEFMSDYIEALGELDEYDKGDKERINPIGTKTSKVEGILDRLDRMKKNTSIELMLKADPKNNINLVEEMQKNQLIAIQMPDVMFNSKTEKDIYCTYWLAKIWFALKTRADMLNDRNKELKINFFVDEIYQVRNCESLLASIINQTAKFNFKPIISCHYINQIPALKKEIEGTQANYMFIKGCKEKVFKEMEADLLPYTYEDMQKMGRFHAIHLVNTGEQYARFITKLPPELPQVKESKRKKKCKNKKIVRGGASRMTLKKRN